MIPSLQAEAEQAVRREDEESFQHRVRRRAVRAGMLRAKVEGRPAELRATRRQRRREDARSRRELIDTFGTELGGQLDPRGLYDIFYVGRGAIAFVDDGTNPNAFAEWSRALNEGGLPVGLVRRGLHGWRLPGLVQSLIAVDPDAAQIRRLG